MRMEVLALVREALPRILTAASRVSRLAVFGKEDEFVAAIQVLRIRLGSLSIALSREIGEELLHDVPPQSLDDAIADLHWSDRAVEQV